MVAIIDYGVGNLFSLKSSLKYIGEEACVTADEELIKRADRIILPGVGAFEDAAKKLEQTGLGQIVVKQAKQGKPMLGICLGMQLLFDVSYEFGRFDGLSLIHGSVKPIEVSDQYTLPHIGWNALLFTEKKSPLFKYIHDGDHVYFVHSYYATDCAESVTANTEYMNLLTASVERDNVYGTQFHPEKSGETGLRILKAFCELSSQT